MSTSVRGAISAFRARRLSILARQGVGRRRLTPPLPSFPTLICSSAMDKRFVRLARVRTGTPPPRAGLTVDHPKCRSCTCENTCGWRHGNAPRPRRFDRISSLLDVFRRHRRRRRLAIRVDLESRSCALIRGLRRRPHHSLDNARQSPMYIFVSGRWFARRDASRARDLIIGQLDSSGTVASHIVSLYNCRKLCTVGIQSDNGIEKPIHLSLWFHTVLSLYGFAFYAIQKISRANVQNTNHFVDIVHSAISKWWQNLNVYEKYVAYINREIDLT